MKKESVMLEAKAETFLEYAGEKIIITGRTHSRDSYPQGAYGVIREKTGLTRGEVHDVIDHLEEQGRIELEGTADGVAVSILEEGEGKQ